MTEAEISGSKELISQRAKAAAQSSSGSKRPVEEGRLQVQVPKKSRTVAKVRMCHASEDKMPGCLPMTLVTTSLGTGHQLGTARQLFPQASSPISGVSTTDPLLLEGGMQIEDPRDETEHSRIVPKASNTDPLLSAGMQIKTPLQDLQGPSPDVIPLGSLCFEFKQYKK